MLITRLMSGLGRAAPKAKETPIERMAMVVMSCILCSCELVEAYCSSGAETLMCGNCRNEIVFVIENLRNKEGLNCRYRKWAKYSFGSRFRDGRICSCFFSLFVPVLLQSGCIHIDLGVSDTREWIVRYIVY